MFVFFRKSSFELFIAAFFDTIMQHLMPNIILKSSTCSTFCFII